jgi:hypothetical protein
MPTPLRVKDITLFLRTLYCKQIKGADVSEGWASIETSGLLPFLLDEQEEYGIRILVFEELRKRPFGRTDEQSILEAFLKVINKDSKLTNLESMVHIEVCTTMGARNVNVLLRAKVDACQNKEVRLRLVEDLRLRSLHNDRDKITNWLTKIAIKDPKPDVRLAAAIALAGRSGQMAIKAQASLLSHRDKPVREFTNRILSGTDDPRWMDILFSMWAKEQKKKTLKNLQKISGLQEILAKRIDEWDTDHLLMCVADDTLPRTVLREKALKLLCERIRQPKHISNENLLAIYHRYREVKDISSPAFQELSVKRQGEEVYQFFLDLARSDRDHDTYVFSLRAIERLGETSRLRSEIFFFPE